MAYKANTICFSCTFFICLCHLHYICSGLDTISADNWIHENGTELVSAGDIFRLGFFTPDGTRKDRRYVGIWYSNRSNVIVWVANRDRPITINGSGTFGIDSSDGNLKVSDNISKHSYFSTNLTSSSYWSPTAKLYDSGNLVLTNDRTSETLWESFEHPTDTFLPGMKMYANLVLTSWLNKNDPASGNFTFQQDTEVLRGYLIKKNGSKPLWRSGGESNTRSFIPRQMNSLAAALLSDNPSNLPIPYNPSSHVSERVNNSRLLIRSDGKIEYLSWDLIDRRWLGLWSEPKGPCSVFKFCGVYSICKYNSDDKTPKSNCTCLPGYGPTDEKEWKASVFTGGCKKKSVECVIDNNTFVPMNFTTMLTNTPSFEIEKEDKCISICQNDCTCRAYSSTDTNKRNLDPKGCWFWYDTDILEGFTDGGDQRILFVRVDHIEGGSSPAQLVQNHRKSFLLRRVVIATSVIFAVALLCCISYISYRRVVAKRKDQEVKENLVLQVYGNEDLIDRDDQFREDDKKDIDVPFFELETILAATDNFSQAYKLGQGGFGPVYKGVFPSGEEIAVKRLSSNSGQGLKEFKNEVVLIAKLQHRNLVRLLGYCIKGIEKILLYEYMPNRSLDAFIFDEKRSMLLDWPARFDIVTGVARGLLYLHQDSRLKIIHRDMKASNILLDEEMNPKISDFGLARIVGRRETESNTNRVIGTYGYMAPEYALEGQFSVMSDAFSFGVVVLEIISGKRNTGFYDSQFAMNLLGYAWGLWKKETPLALLDEKLVESCNEREVFKCIVIGLLCVQEDPNDRPNMSKVLFMLSSETEYETLPNPKQPAFVTRKLFLGTTSSSSTKPETLNEITFTEEDGR